MEATLVKEKGVVRMDMSFDQMCSLLANGRYTVSIARKRETRSMQQNSLLWMWYKCIEDSTGQDKMDIHDYYKSKFLTRQVNINGRWVNATGSTTKLTITQMSEYLEKVKADAATEMGIILPSPEDYGFEEFKQAYQ